MAALMNRERLGAKCTGVVASGAMGARTRVAAAVSDPEAPGTALVFTNCYRVPLTQLLPRRSKAAATASHQRNCSSGLFIFHAKK